VAVLADALDRLTRDLLAALRSDQVPTSEAVRRQHATGELPSRGASRHAHGGESRIRHAGFPARMTLEEFDFSFQRSV
jgi:DNA replication protein DnaC